MSGDTTSPALLLNGLDQSVKLDTATALGLTNASFTVEIWIRPDELRAGDMAILGTDKTGDSVGLHLVLRDGAPHLGFYKDDLTANVALLAGQWAHVAWRFELSTKTQSILINGVQVASRAAKAPFQGTDEVFLGRYAQRSTFKGALRDLRIWSIARPDAEILEDFCRQLTGDEPGLNVWWPFDSGKGEVDWERSRRRRAPIAVLQNALFLRNQRMQPPSDRTVLELRSPGDQVVCEAFRWPKTNRAVTLEWWMKLASEDLCDATLIRVGDGTGTNTFTVRLEAATCSLVWEYGEVKSGPLYASLQFKLGGWMHVAVSSHGSGDGFGSEGGPRKIWVDGKLFASQGGASCPADDLTGLQLGAPADAAPLPICLSELRVWTKVRTAAEIQQSMNRRVVQVEDGLLSGYPLRGGRVVPHIGAAAWHGERVGGAAWVQDESLPSGLWGSSALGIQQGTKLPLPPLNLTSSEVYLLEMWVRVDCNRSTATATWRKETEIGSIALEFTCPDTFTIHVMGRQSLSYPNARPPGGPRFWHHVQLFIYPWSMSVKVDGVKSAEWQSSLYGSFLSGEFTVVGVRQNDPHMYVRELRFWDLNQASHPHKDPFRTLLGGEKGLLTYLRMDEGAGDAVVDYCGEADHVLLALPKGQFFRAMHPQSPAPESSTIPTRAAAYLNDPAENKHISVDVSGGPPLSLFTVEYWLFVPESCSSYNAPVGINSTTNSIRLDLCSQHVEMSARWVQTTGGSESELYTDVSAGEGGCWVHQAWISNGESKSLYVNGALVWTGTAAAPSGAVTQITIGNVPVGGLNFLITEFRLWSTARTQEQISATMGTPLLGSEAGLAVYLPLDEGAGTTVRNLAPGGTPGTYTLGSWARGQLPSVSSSLCPQGFTVESTPELQITGDQTIELWVRLARFAIGDIVLIKKAWGAEGSIDLRKSGEVIYRWGIKDGDRGAEGEFQYVEGGKGMRWVGVWRHVAVVRDLSQSNLVSIYIDGVRVGSTTAIFRQSGLSSSPWTLGSLGPTNATFGQIADVRLWRVARTEEQLRAAMLPTAVIDDSGLVARWRLDEAPAWMDSRALPASVPSPARIIVHKDAWTVDRATTAPRQVRAAELTNYHYLVVDPMASWPDKAWTLELWVRAGGGSMPNAVFSYLSGDLRVSLANTGSLRLICDGQEHNSGVSIIDGSWHQLLVSWQRSDGRLSLAVDGVVVLERTWRPGQRFPAKGTLLLGQTRESPPTYVLSGELASVRLWSIVRDPKAAPPTTLYPQHLVAFWPLNQRSGAIGRELLGGQHAVFARGEKWSRPGAVLDRRQALLLDGPDYVSLPDLPALNTLSRLTIEAWVRPATTATTWTAAPVLSRMSSEAGWELRAGKDGVGFVIVLDRVAHSVSFTGIVADHWVHLAAVYDGAQALLYVNGVQVAFKAVTGQITPHLDRPLIGRRPDAKDGFQGQLSDLRLWGVARGGADIARSLWGRLTGEEEGLLGYWKAIPVEDPAELFDSGPNGLHGRAVGAAWPFSDLLIGPATLTALVGDLHQELKDLRGQRVKLREELAAQQRQVIALDGQVVTLSERETKLNNRIQELEKQNLRIAELDAELTRRKNEVALVEAKLKTLTDERGQVSLEELISNANKEVTRAREALSAQGGAYQLGRVTLDLKMLPGPTGVGVSFPSASQLSNLGDGKLSSLSVDFTARDQSERATANAARLPDVCGYTEVVARRKLAEAGYLIETCYQAVAEDGKSLSQVNRVVNQLPAPDSELPPASNVIIFVGKSSQA